MSDKQFFAMYFLIFREIQKAGISLGYLNADSTRITQFEYSLASFRKTKRKRTFKN